MKNANNKMADDAEREAEDRKHAHDAELNKRYGEDKRRKAFDKARDEMADDAKNADDAKGAYDKEMEERGAEDARREAYDAKFEAEDSALPTKGDQDGTGARGEKTPHGAMDAKSVAAVVDAAVRAERVRADSVDAAKRAVRDTLGEVYGMDSAGDIYRAALEQVGVDMAQILKGTEQGAWAAYQAATQRSARPAGYAMDTAAATTAVAANQTSISKHLSRISVKG